MWTLDFFSPFFFFWSRKRLQRAGLTHSQGEVALFSAGALIWSDICDGGETHPGECLAPQVAFDKRGTVRQSMHDPNKQTDNGGDTFTACLFMRWPVIRIKVPVKVKAGRQVRRSLKPLIPLQTWYFYA